VDRYGLIIEDGQGVRPGQQLFARRQSEVASWRVSNPQEIGLLDVVRHAKPTVLIGVSGQPGAFTEEVIRAMAKSTQRPIIFPLSNPTSRCEAKPQDILDWTEGRALIGTGSPFAPARVDGKEVQIDQTNNSYIFPGLALGIISSHAKHVSDAMIKSSALALAALSPTLEDKHANLLPPLSEIRSVSLEVAQAVGKQAIQEGLAAVDGTSFERELAVNVWEPLYVPYELLN
jgi:malate dehydrogenase (oxaloacetate-decarboxylating)